MRCHGTGLSTFLPGVRRAAPSGVVDPSLFWPILPLSFRCDQSAEGPAEMDVPVGRQPDAVELVLKQAESLSNAWSK